MKTKDVNISIVFKLKFDKKERREKKRNCFTPVVGYELNHE